MQEPLSPQKSEVGLTRKLAIEIRPELAPTTSSDLSLAFVKECIKSCRNSHPHAEQMQAKSLKIYEISDDWLCCRCLDRGVLSSRAWVFQERYLARGTIYFNAERIFYEC